MGLLLTRRLCFVPEDLNEVIVPYEELISRLRRSDRSAFNDIYRLFYRALCSYASLMVSEETAEDVVHDIFLKLWESRENLSPETEGGNIRAYLFRSTYNACISLIRKRLSRLNHESFVVRQVEEDCRYWDWDRNETVRKIYGREIKSILEDAISDLPEKCREVFLMSYSDGMPDKEIAQKLGLSLSTVQNHIHNALVRLRARLKSTEL